MGNREAKRKSSLCVDGADCLLQKVFGRQISLPTGKNVTSALQLAPTYTAQGLLLLLTRGGVGCLSGELYLLVCLYQELPCPFRMSLHVVVVVFLRDRDGVGGLH